MSRDMVMTLLYACLLASFAIQCWGSLFVNQSLQYPCNIKKVFVKSTEETGNIIKKFPQEPVIFVGARDRNQVLAKAASRKTLRELHGNTMVTLASSNTYSHDTVDMTMAEYLDMLERDAHVSTDARANETFYLFGNNFSDLFKRLEKHYVLPPCAHCKSAGATTLGIGGLQSGVAFHFHGPGFSEVITGRKQFFLYPPGRGVEVPAPPNMTMSRWVTEVYPTLQRGALANPAFEQQQQQQQQPGEKCGSPASSDSSSGSGSGSGGDDRSGPVLPIYANLQEELMNRGGAEGLCAAEAGAEASAGLLVPPSETLERLYECVLEPGDMLFFPNRWQHATLNLDRYNLFVSVFLDLQLMRHAS